MPDQSPSQTPVPIQRNLRHMFVRLVAGDFTHIADDQMRLRAKRLNAFSIGAFIVMVLYIIFQDLLLGRTEALLRDGITAVFLCVPIVWVRYTKHLRIVFHSSVLVGWIGQMVAFYTNGSESNLYWLGATPIAAYLLLGRWGGMGWTTVLVGSSVFTWIFQQAGLLHLSADLLHQLLLATFGVATLGCVLFVYEGMNVQNQRLIAEQDKSLQGAFARLNAELDDNKKMARHLGDVLGNTQKSNKQLEDTKAAMMNLLEDAKELEEQLKREKLNVERTVTDRTRELHEEQARLKASINSLDSGFLMTLRDGTVIAYNPALLKLLGMIGDTDMAPSSLTLVDLQQKMADSFDLITAIRDCTATGRAFTPGDLNVGSKILNLYGVPITMDGRFEPIGVVVLVSDVTELKMLERTKDEFVSIASHELRTPLTAIRGNSAMLLDMYPEQMSGEIRQMLQDIKDGSIRLISVVNQFLTMSRLEQGRTTFEMSPEEIDVVARRVITNLQPLAKEKNLELRLAIPEDIPPILADSARLEEVCTNLIGNAIKYTPKGSVTVTAVIIGQQVRVRVTDTGHGIDVESQPRLFRKFQQAASNILTRDDSHSTGLGLYITKLLVEQMGGTIMLEESELGKGSTFSFTLPIAKDYNKKQVPNTSSSVEK